MSHDDMRRTRRTVVRTAVGSTVALASVGLVNADHTHPDVNTQGAGDITQTSAVLYGEVEGFGDGSSSADAWFQYRVYGTSTWLNTDKVQLDDPGEYSTFASNLSSDTTYEFRAIAENDSGVTGTGSIMTFKTLSDDEQIQ